MTDLHSTIPAIITRRNAVGADSFEGKRLSLLKEQIENGVSPVQTIAEIMQIQRDGGRYIPEHHSYSKGA